MGIFGSKEFRALEIEVKSLPVLNGMEYKIRKERSSFYIEQFCTLDLFAENANRMLGENLVPGLDMGQSFVHTDTYGPYGSATETKRAITVIKSDLEANPNSCIGPEGHPKLGPLGEWL